MKILFLSLNIYYFYFLIFKEMICLFEPYLIKQKYEFFYKITTGVMYVSFVG
ncbi:conserved hypothetical protein [Onion yellows phytoplasma OY-M]|uniref:Uncharacterized protein n=1 Tax=Onion yellows phytoplasma (strain OY-M) TaxID=262768 RepID=Q6YPK6_ONYPE|nr:conserved hypothetical protein [Onion yellows phytoplasma OY-M]